MSHTDANKRSGRWVTHWFLAWLAFATVTTAAEPPVATVIFGFTSVYWQPMMPDYALVMTITGPNGFKRKNTYGPGQMPGLEIYDDEGSVLEDGQYTYRLQALLRIDPVADQDLADAREQGDEQMVDILHQLGRVPEKAVIQTGTIHVRNGSFVVDE